MFVQAFTTEIAYVMVIAVPNRVVTDHGVKLQPLTPYVDWAQQPMELQMLDSLLLAKSVPPQLMEEVVSHYKFRVGLMLVPRPNLHMPNRPIHVVRSAIGEQYNILKSGVAVVRVQCHSC